jgi:LCP family protein required for cell wall assembly
MIRRDRARGHAAPTARARRLRAATDRDDQLRALGIDPVAYERTAASAWGRPRVERVEDPPPSPITGSREGAPPRRPLRIKRVVVTAVVLVLVILVVGSVLLYQRVDAFNKAVSSAPTMSTSLFGPLAGKDRVNVLMIGYSGDPKHGGTYLADSLNILSIDPSANATTLIPIPRDLWIQGLPALLPKGGKVNLAFALGWDAGGWQEAGRAQAAVVARVTGLRIDHWISLDFAGLSDMVDAVGRVTVVNPRAFSYTFWEGNYLKRHWAGQFKKGTLQLNGAQALTYTRVRYTSVQAEASDFARSVRQQAVISALRSKLGSGGFGSLGPGLAMMDALKGHMKTDLSALDLFLLSGHLHTDRRLELKEGVVLQAGRNNAGSYILFPVGAKRLGDYAPLRLFLASELAKPIPSPRPSATATPAR